MRGLVFDMSTDVGRKSWKKFLAAVSQQGTTANPQNKSQYVHRHCTAYLDKKIDQSKAVTA